MDNDETAPFKLVPIPMKGTFIDAIDKALPRLGYNSRAQFLRDAAFEKASRAGVVIPREETIGGRVGPQAKSPNFEDQKTLDAAAQLAAVVAGPPIDDESPLQPKVVLPIENESARVGRNRVNDKPGSIAAKRVPKKRAGGLNPSKISP